MTSKYAKFAICCLAGLLAASAAGAAGAGGDAIDHYLFVPNRASADVAVIDTRTDRVIDRLKVGRVPHQVVVSRALGKLVATNTADDTLSIVDLASGATTTLALGRAPEHMALAADGRLVAVGNIAGGTVSLVALDAGREIARIGGLFEPHNLTFGPAGRRLYVANLGADHVGVIDVVRRRLTGEIRVAPATALAARPAGASRQYQGVVDVTATIDGRLGFAAHGEGDTLAVIDLASGRRLASLALGDLPWRAYPTPDGRYMVVPNNGDGTVSVVATATRKVVATLPGAADMTGVNSDRTGRVVFVISRGENKAVVLDLGAMRKLGEIALATAPETGVTTPDGGKLYIALSGSDRVAVIDTARRRLIGMIDGVGRGPWGATMAGARNYCH